MAVEISLKAHQEKPFWVIGRWQLITLKVDFLPLSQQEWRRSDEQNKTFILQQFSLHLCLLNYEFRSASTQLWPTLYSADVEADPTA